MYISEMSKLFVTYFKLYISQSTKIFCIINIGVLSSYKKTQCMKYTNFKLKLRPCLAILVLFVFAAAVNAQQTSISGIVKDASNGEPILGANILEKGTSNGTITNLDGQFTLKVAANATLIVRYIGFASVEVPVAGQKNIVIQIKEDAVALG